MTAFPAVEQPHLGVRFRSNMKIAVTTLAFCVAALLALGMVMLYSSSMTQVGTHYLMRQLIWCAAGLAVCVMAISMDYHLLKKTAVPLYAFAVILLALVWHFGVLHKGECSFIILVRLNIIP